MDERKVRQARSKLIYGLVSLIILVLFITQGCAVARAVEQSPYDERAVGTTIMEEFVEGEMGKEMVSEIKEAEMYEEEAAAPMEAENASSDLYTQAGNADTVVNQQIDTKLIKNASVSIEVEKGKFKEVFFEVTSLAEQNNGYVSNSESYSDPEGNMTSGVVTLRIDKDKFDFVIGNIKEMGKVNSISIYVQDVTQEYVDNESRLKNLKAQQERLLELMDQSNTVKDSIEVQRELSNVEGQIEVIKGRQNYLDNLIAYSTIDVYIKEPQPITEPSNGGFLGAIKRGARGALTAVKVITMVFIAASPLIILAGIILIIVWQSLRARNRRRAARQKQDKGKQKK